MSLYFKFFMIFVLVQLLVFLIYYLCEPFVLSGREFGYLGMNLFLMSLMFSLIVAIVTYAVFSVYMDKDFSCLISTLALFIFLGYSNLYNIVVPVSLERSFSVSIFLELYAQKDGAIKIDRFLEIQDQRDIYSLRLNEMLSSGLIVEESGSYKLTKKGRFFSAFYSYMNSYLGIR